MNVDVYITLHPSFPGRAFVAAWPPNGKAHAALRVQGARVYVARVNVPDLIPLQSVAAVGFELKYLNQTVRYYRDATLVRTGVVVKETATEIAVKWDSGETGTFKPALFESKVAENIFKLGDADGETTRDPETGAE